MNYRHLTLTTFASLGMLLGAANGSMAQMSHEGGMGEPMVEQTSQFQRIDQPLWTRVMVTGAGFGLIGLELWWFVFSKPKAKSSQDG